MARVALLYAVAGVRPSPKAGPFGSTNRTGFGRAAHSASFGSMLGTGSSSTARTTACTTAAFWSPVRWTIVAPGSVTMLGVV